MKLTKNEKSILKMLMENARTPDSTIAKKLNISSQAIGKIRKKLEKSLIESYTLKLNYSKMGISTFAIALAKLTQSGLEKGELEVEQKLLENPHIIQVYRLPNATSTHVILYGFTDTDELDDFFHSQKSKKELHNFIENKDLFVFSHHSLIKNSPSQLFNKIIDEVMSAEPEGAKFFELENFKKKLRTN